MKQIKQLCVDCHKNIGYKFNDGKPKRCAKCRTAFIRKNPTQHPTYGLRHSNREKFRKNTYINVNYNDRIIQCSRTGNSIKKYRMTCVKCGADRGYQLHIDARRLCASCRDKNITRYTPEQKRIRCAMKANLAARLKQRLINKNKKSTFDVLPYTIEDLKRHLESLFLPGMSWDNYGEWHIDHVTPDSWFQYNSVDDDGFKRSWALSNLQPLWAQDNLKKSNKYKG